MKPQFPEELIARAQFSTAFMQQHHNFSQISAGRKLSRALCHHVQSTAMAEMYSIFTAMDNSPYLRFLQILHLRPFIF